MKKNFFRAGIAAIAFAGLYVAACSTDDGLSGQSTSDDVTVSFSLGLAHGASTRAAADTLIGTASHANRLTYAVYDDEGLTRLGATTVDTDFPTTVSLTLGKSQTYQIVFWADNKEADKYAFDADSAAITVDYSIHNNDAADAFCTMHEVTVDADMSIDETLTRPFAQLNVGASDATVASDAGVVIAASEVEISGLANRINLRTGEISGDVTTTFPATAVPNQHLTVGDSAYTYLAMDYLLVPDGKSTVQAAYTFSPQKGNAVTRTITAIPVQTNYRTNLLGSVLTSNVALTLIVDPIFEADNPTVTLK